MPRAFSIVHPVRHGGAAAALAVHGAGLGDHPRVQREGLGERGLAGVGVADDGEGTAGAVVGHPEKPTDRHRSAPIRGGRRPVASGDDQ